MFEGEEGGKGCTEFGDSVVACCVSPFSCLRSCVACGSDGWRAVRQSLLGGLPWCSKAWQTAGTGCFFFWEFSLGTKPVALLDFVRGELLLSQLETFLVARGHILCFSFEMHPRRPRLLERHLPTDCGVGRCGTGH